MALKGTTCVERTRIALANAEQHRDRNAFVELFAEEALQRAQVLDKKKSEGGSLGALFGVIVSIKDVIAYQGHSLTACSKILDGFRSVYSATVVERLLEADAIIIGRTNCDEFAMGSDNRTSIYGPVKNAIGNNKIPGGSSGGAAVSVQVGACDVAVASDTGGSVRQPAGLCGVVGFKPTYGTISRHGLIAYGSSFDQIGLLGYDLSQLEMVFEVIKGRDDHDATLIDTPDHTPFATDEPPRIGLMQNALEHKSLDPHIKESIQKLTGDLQSNGASVETFAFEFLDYVIPTYYVLASAEASSNLSRYDGVRYGYRAEEAESLDDMYRKTRTVGFGDEVKRRILLGTFVLSYGYYDQYFGKAQQVRRLIRDELQVQLDRYDYLILPMSPSVAWGIDEVKSPVELYLADIYSVLANLAGLPAMSLPLWTNKSGMPYGLQILGAPFQEKKLLFHAREIMSSHEKR
ncbi:MAG: Asp-tRNA(Asn)/Glu-tRNA(Gln) amidotransferase subunit GatA [Saprospiraceae bacterium]|nr:Asp-tRNA(Asn)/Glu-tRNA(Gln) amidotransferase subunit GatA [Saprospiraceae bacterium]